MLFFYCYVLIHMYDVFTKSLLVLFYARLSDLDGICIVLKLNMIYNVHVQYLLKAIKFVHNVTL